MSTILRVLLVVIVASTAVNSKQQYCNVCRDHTMCQYQGVGHNCSPYLRGGVNDSTPADIVHIHNSFRQKVANGSVADGAPGPQPQAANMHVMKWDDELATIAQRWADQCTFEHDSCRNLSQYYVGQNIFMSTMMWTPDIPDWNGAIKYLFSEVKDFNPAWISPFDDTRAKIGHYSQIVWAESTTVGCGYSKFRSSDAAKWINQLYVCNYGPGGNLRSGTMYKKGKPCSECVGSCSKEYPGLCVKN